MAPALVGPTQVRKQADIEHEAECSVGGCPRRPSLDGVRKAFHGNGIDTRHPKREQELAGEDWEEDSPGGWSTQREARGSMEQPKKMMWLRARSWQIQKAKWTSDPAGPARPSGN